MAAPVRKLAGRPAPVDLSGPPAAALEKVPPPAAAVPSGWTPPVEDLPPGPVADAVDAFLTDPDSGEVRTRPEYAPDPDANAVAAEALKSWDDPDPAVDSWGTLQTVAYHSDGTEHALSETDGCEQCNPPATDLTEGIHPGGVNLSDVLAALAGLRDDVNRLTAGVEIIGQQQQFMTNSMSAALEQFQQMMGAGGPMKMLGAMFGGGKKGLPQ